MIIISSTAGTTLGTTGSTRGSSLKLEVTFTPDDFFCGAYNDLRIQTIQEQTNQLSRPSTTHRKLVNWVPLLLPTRRPSSYGYKELPWAQQHDGLA